jgi:peptidyl-prolyl cis-trans isomerase A (cyclophilin A)
VSVRYHQAAGMVLTAAFVCIVGCQKVKPNPVVVIKTSMGSITVELDQAKAPVTVANFLTYADEGHYSGTIFHRVKQGFMIQGGGMEPDLSERPTHPPIKNESANGLRNEAGTLAMARTPDADSATSQFFINLKGNYFLDRAQARDGVGYAVFGRVTEGMDVVRRIAAVPVRDVGQAEAVPLTPVVIESVTRKDDTP